MKLYPIRNNLLRTGLEFAEFALVHLSRSSYLLLQFNYHYKMALSLFSPSPLHNTLRSTIIPLSSCRWNSTTRSGPPMGTGTSTGM